MAEPKITLNNWSLGMSADEYVGGSFFYAEGIDCQSNSKSFKIGPRLINTSVNKRTKGESVALIYNKNDDNVLSFTLDGRIENNQSFNGLSINPTEGGAYYRRPSGNYYNGLKIGDTLLGISTDKIDRITTLSGLFGGNLVLNPGLTSDTNWNVSAGWTTGTGGATHTSGTAPLFSDNFTTVVGKRYRVAIKMSGCTTGSVTVYGYGGPNMTLNSSSDYWSMIVSEPSGGASLQIAFLPTTTFNGTIEYVTVQEYDSTKLLADDITITSATSHPLLAWKGLIFIGSGSSIDIVDTTSWTIYDTVNIIDDNYTIKDITQSGSSIVIWASDGVDSKQYYWNGVDEVASEVIDWVGLDISSATNDETKTYVITGGQTKKPRVYLSSGYQRQLLAKGVYDGIHESYAYPYLYKAKRFDFYNYNSNSVSILNDTLYIPARGGIYTYGSKTPGMSDIWNKPIIHDPLGTQIAYASTSRNDTYYYSHKDVSNINKIAKIDYTYHQLSGYLVTNPILWDNLSTTKSLHKLMIGYKNVDSTLGNIKIYAIVDDNYFWTFNVTGVTTTPTAGSTYQVGGTNIKLEVISTDITDGNGTILLKANDITFDGGPGYIGSLTKLTGIGDATITSSGYANRALIKTIESDQQGYGKELIFGSSFIDTHMPDRHKIQLVIELNSSSFPISPEVYDISILSDIVDADA